MGVSYKKLWILIIDKDMTNVGVRKAKKISPATFTKLKKNEIVSLDILIKICRILDCDIGDIVEVVNNCCRELVGQTARLRNSNNVVFGGLFMEKYSSGLVAESFWFIEFKSLIKLRYEGKSWDDIKALCLNENLLGISKEYRAKRIFGYLKNRIEAIEDGYLEIFILY